jgi:phage host-nuclease inhibitor protein Gam
MPAARRKAAKLPVPNDNDAAIALLGEFAAVQAAIEHVEADRRAGRAAIDEAADRALEPLEARLKALFAQLKPWWAIAGGALLPRGRKSMELGGCLIGHRLTTPKLGLGTMSVEVAVAALQQHGWGADCTRVKVELDKPAILKVLDGPAGPQLAALGFKAVQREEFFIDPLPTKKPATAEMAEPAEVAA